MKITHIIKKLEEIEMPVNNLNLGEFDYIGEFSAKKTRDPSNKSFKEVGWSFRPNYERGLLIYSLIRKARSSSYLEIGFGRGYSSLCAAKAMYDAGIDGKIMIIDPFFDEQHINTLSKIFPSQWFSMMNFVKSTSDNALNQISDKFDFIYIDGDHTYPGAKTDWDCFSPHLADGGIVAFHDVMHGFDGPTRVFAESVLPSDRCGTAGVVGSIGWAQFHADPTKAARHRAANSRLAEQLGRVVPYAAAGDEPSGAARLLFRLRRWQVPHAALAPDNWAAALD